ncbi:hypothetical protein LJC58_01635 [Lachnospiraceae bacterium OttesenSCG-928-D06]|nr:hypothetical protein [Lachnospiraceae bacterium OttesenSCG-928-D06]
MSRSVSEQAESVLEILGNVLEIGEDVPIPAIKEKEKATGEECSCCQIETIMYYMLNKSECVPVRSNLSSSSVCIYISNQSGAIWHSRYPE